MSPVHHMRHASHPHVKNHGHFNQSNLRNKHPTQAKRINVITSRVLGDARAARLHAFGRLR